MDLSALLTMSPFFLLGSMLIAQVIVERKRMQRREKIMIGLLGTAMILFGLVMCMISGGI